MAGEKPGLHSFSITQLPNYPFTQFPKEFMAENRKNPLTDKQVQTIRSRFRIFERKIYLNSCSQGALSDAVQAG
ncbi:MAG TPA: hypothetical protein VJ723_09465, partial [Candidatus Angelobacter sp.]|nr:hypothetical protein [Candidatus Angelobacter sp.]